MSANFTILGMNIGASDHDYRFLHNQVTTKYQNIYDVLIDYQKEGDQKKIGLLEEEIFTLLERVRDDIPIEKEHSVLNTQLARLLIDKGWDILEGHMNEAAVRDLLSENSPFLIETFAERIKDFWGAQQFKESYPRFCRFLMENFASELPAVFSQLSNRYPFSQNPLQCVKQKLAENFFRNIVNVDPKHRIGVIALQEVYRRNREILDIFREKGHYHICHRGDSTDAAVIIDTDLFENCQNYEHPRSPAVYAKQSPERNLFLFRPISLVINWNSQKIEIP